MGEETILLIATMTQVFTLNTAAPDTTPKEIYKGTRIHFALPTQSGSAVIFDGSALVIWNGKELASHATGIPDGITCAVVLQEDPLKVLIGTEGAHLYAWESEMDAAERLESFEKLEVREKWHTPWGGPAAVRSLARTSDDHIYADIHVGSIMRSPDGGATWEPVADTINEDVHQVAACHAAPERVYANTANGVYVSHDRGRSWLHRTRGKLNRYGRAIAVHPREPNVIIATDSRGPHGKDLQARLYRSDNDGESWTPVAGGFPETSPGNIDTHRIAFAANGNAFAAVGDQLYIGKEKGALWAKQWKAPQNITMISCP